MTDDWAGISVHVDCGSARVSAPCKRARRPCGDRFGVDVRQQEQDSNAIAYCHRRSGPRPAMAIRNGIAVLLLLSDIDSKSVPTWSSCTFAWRADARAAAVDMDRYSCPIVGH